MASEVLASRSATVRNGRQRTTSLFWIYAWALASSIPIIPYATPLWSGALADTPLAYLVWIPVFAFTWAGWTLRRALSYQDDEELNGIMGLPLLAFCAALLVAGMTTWQYYFVGQSVGLLIWPFWALGMAWLLFGVGVTRYLIRPLAYLLLTWPPLYTGLVNLTNPILLVFANRFVIAMSHVFPWLHVLGHSGKYLIDYGTKTVTVYVTSACSGADSLLAVVILFPIILVAFKGAVWKKTLTILLAAILALVANWLRLAILIMAIHYTSPGFSLGVLHPVLGILLFIAMVAIVVSFAQMIGLQNRRFQKGTSLRKPGRVRFSLSLLAATILTVLLWPLYQASLGTDGAPIPIATDSLSKLLPQVRGWTRSLVGRYDAASVLGPGAKTTAVTYTTAMGDYALAEWWWTYQPVALAGYPEHNCLLFHGSKVVNERKLTIANGITATVFTVLLPPGQVGGKQNLFLDTVYTFATDYRGRTAYIRSEIARPIALQVRPDSAFVKAMPVAIRQIIDPSYPRNQPIYPFDANTRVYLENYFTFIKQFSGQVFPARPVTSNRHLA